MIASGGGWTEDHQAARQLNRFNLCRLLSCLPSELDAEDAQDIEDFLVIADLEQKYAPKPEIPTGDA